MLKSCLVSNAVSLAFISIVDVFCLSAVQRHVMIVVLSFSLSLSLSLSGCRMAQESQQQQQLQQKVSRRPKAGCRGCHVLRRGVVTIDVHAWDKLAANGSTVSANGMLVLELLRV